MAPVPAATNPGGRRRRTRAPGASVLALLPGAVMLLFIAATWACVHLIPGRLVSAAKSMPSSGGCRPSSHASTRTGLTGGGLTARLVEASPELKALFETDTATIRDYCSRCQQRNPGTGKCPSWRWNPAGEALAQTDQTTPSAEKMSLQALLDIWNRDGDRGDAGKPAPCQQPRRWEARGTVLGRGWCAAAPVDAAFARGARRGHTGRRGVARARIRRSRSDTAHGQAQWIRLPSGRRTAAAPDATVRIDVEGWRGAPAKSSLSATHRRRPCCSRWDEHALRTLPSHHPGSVAVGLAAIVLTIAGSVWFGTKQTEILLAAWVPRLCENINTRNAYSSGGCPPRVCSCAWRRRSLTRRASSQAQRPHGEARDFRRDRPGAVRKGCEHDGGRQVEKCSGRGDPRA